MNEQNLQLLKVTGIKDQEYIVALVEGGGDISSLGKIVEGPFEGWAFTYPKNASWHLWLEIEHLHQITEWISNLNKYGRPEMFSDEDANAVPCPETGKPDYPTRDLDTPRPYWANWLALDNDGAWYWYKDRPTWDSMTEEWVPADFSNNLDFGFLYAGFTPHSGVPAEYSIYYVSEKGEDNE